LEIQVATVGRFYGDGFRWASGLPLSVLLRRLSLIPSIVERERGG
jgi:hypothetical protein